MFLYNSLSKKKEVFVPKNDKEVTMYTCGPTVYHSAHIGNLRSYVMEDILEKTLIYNGYKVKRVMNITDVGHMANDSENGEDKMYLGAKREGKSVLELANFYMNKFFEDCDKLNIQKPLIVEKATDNIEECIKFIKVLLDKGYAYESGGNIYFDISKINEYYVFNEYHEEDLLVGVRSGVEEDKQKKNKGDFGLWFTNSKFDKQELKWNSPWGIGYPGWHIECSTIAIKNFGKYLDLHCGGVDNIFPHHTNEIAQSEAFVGDTWCQHWFHIQHLNLADKKMSKSSGTIITVDTLINEGYDPIVFRFLCLMSHYRKPLQFTYEALNNSKNSYERLIQKIDSILNCLGITSDNDLEEKILKNDSKYIVNKRVNAYDNKFKEALNNDINTSMAVTILFDVVKDFDLKEDEKLFLINRFDRVLSLNLISFFRDNSSYILSNDIDDSMVTYIELMIKQRANAKKEKNFALADKIREDLLKKNIKLIDTRNGTIWDFFNN